MNPLQLPITLLLIISIGIFWNTLLFATGWIFLIQFLKKEVREVYHSDVDLHDKLIKSKTEKINTLNSEIKGKQTIMESINRIIHRERYKKNMSPI